MYLSLNLSLSSWRRWPAPSFTGRCRGVKCRHFPGFTALSHLAIATKISHSYHFHPTTNIPPNHQSWRMKIKNGCGKCFCTAPKKIWTAILDFIRKQGYYGGIIAMKPQNILCPPYEKEHVNASGVRLIDLIVSGSPPVIWCLTQCKWRAPVVVTQKAWPILYLRAVDIIRYSFEKAEEGVSFMYRHIGIFYRQFFV